MNSQDILFPKNTYDECYTPPYGVKPILEFVKPFENQIIWCPFDDEQSEFVKILKSNNFNVINSHIKNGQDFYKYEPKKWGLIISNPPFSNKRKIFERALGFNKPFALLMSLAWLNDSAPKQLFFDKPLQLLMFDKRIKYKGMGNKITFSSAYYCYNFLPQQIVMRKIQNGNAGENK